MGNIKYITNKNKQFCIIITFPVGSIHEKKSEYGVAHFLEHMLFQSSKNYRYGRLIEELSTNSYTLNAFTTYDRTQYYCMTSIDNYKKIIELMYELIFEPRFHRDEFKNEKKVIFEEYWSGVQSNRKKLYTVITETIYDKKNPYSHTIIGNESSLKNMTIEKISIPMFISLLVLQIF